MMASVRDWDTGCLAVRTRASFLAGKPRQFQLPLQGCSHRSPKSGAGSGFAIDRFDQTFQPQIQDGKLRAPTLLPALAHYLHIGAERRIMRKVEPRTALLHNITASCTVPFSWGAVMGRRS